MMNMINLGRGTTPLYTINFNGIAIEDIANVLVTFKQAGVEILTKQIPDVKLAENHAQVRLTQEETLAFKKGEAEFQIRFVTKDSFAYKSDIFKVKVSDVLQGGVIQ